MKLRKVTALPRKHIARANRDTKPTVKDVLLKTWAQDTRVMALSRVHLDTPSGECTVDHEGRRVYYQSFEEALDGEIAYLNSAAEVGK